jgi:SAM-dependent methyltransferase
MTTEERPYHMRRLQLMATLLKGGRLLDIGCAERSLKSFVNESEYFGLDLLDADVLASAEALPFRGGSFDSVGCGETLEHLRSPQACIEEIGRVLKDDGVAVVTTPNLGTLFHASSFMAHPEHVNVMDYRRLVSMLGEFSVVRRHGFDIFLEPPIHGILARIPYRMRRALANQVLALEKILVVELRK